MTATDTFKNALMRQAYLDFLDWACRKDEFIEQFHETTGKKAHEDFEAFRLWVTETYWGDTE